MTGELSTPMTIAVLGGTGKEGKGLVYRWARAGYRVLIGSRSPERAQAAAAELTGLLDGKAVIEGMSNPEAAEYADVAVLAVPYTAHRETLESVRTAMQGKTLIDVTVPLAPPKHAPVEQSPTAVTSPLPPAAPISCADAPLPTYNFSFVASQVI